MLQRVSNTRQGVASVEDSTAPNLKMDIDGVEAILPEIACHSLVPRYLASFFLVGCLEVVEGVPWHHQLQEHHLGREHRSVRLLLCEELCCRWFSIRCDPNILLARKRCTFKERLSLSSSHHSKMGCGGESLRGI